MPHLLSGFNEDRPGARAFSYVLGDLMSQRPF